MTIAMIVVVVVVLIGIGIKVRRGSFFRRHGEGQSALMRILDS